VTRKIFSIEYLKYWGVLLLFGIWWLGKIAFFSGNYYLPGPTETIHRIGEFFVKGEIYQDIFETLKRFAAGFSLAVIFGIPTGFLLGYSQKGYATFEIILDFFRSIPVTALFPLFILFYGISEATITAMVAVACFFVIVLNSAYGVLYVNRTYLTVIKTLGASRFQTFREVIFYESLPFLFVGLRVAVSFGLIVVVVSEMFIGRKYGLGSRVYNAHETYLITDVYALTIIIGLIGYVVNKSLILMEGHLVHWRNQEIKA
jgi:ABC-type nitrate/sulfonate/bicarbonate transport system permease component